MKKILLTTIITILCFSFSSCGDNKKATSDNTNTSTDNITQTEEQQPETTNVEVGDKITLEFAEITVDEASINADIKTSIKTGNTTYISGPEVSTDSKYVYIRGKIKNLAKAEITSPEISGNVEIDGYHYELDSIDIIESDGSSAFSLSPLATYTYTLYAKIPNELADSQKPCTLNMGFEDNFAQIFSSEKTTKKYNYNIKIQ